MIPETREDRPIESADLSALIDAVQCGIGRVADLERSLESLDALLLTGRPHAIADAAMAVELSLSEAEPVFQQIGQTLKLLGIARLQDAAQRLRQSDVAAAARAEALHAALRRFAKRNAASHRRAQGLSRGLNASLRTLHALGSIQAGRLIAEA